MYHHHSQQQGTQPFSNGPRPPHHQPPPNQHQNRSSTDMLSQVMGFQFPRPTQLPDELESALAIRGGRDMDHRLIDNMSRPNPHQNQSSGSGISQRGTYGSDNQSSHQQGIDWSSYQPPTKLFAGPPPSGSHQPQRHQGLQQQPPQSSHTGTSIPSWSAPASDSPSPQTRLTLGGGSGSGGTGGEGQGLYTPESAGSILASFGLSNDDLEVLSHYPDDQLTPDTLPFILRDIQINKSGNQKTVASSSSSSFSLPPSCSSPLTRSGSPEVPSLLTVTQTAGKVIDYGHASRAKEESGTQKTFKREPLSSERIVKMYPSLSSSSSNQKVDKAGGRQVRLEPTESSKHGDQDYRRSSSDQRKSSRSPGREFPPSTKSRNLDQDYRREGVKPRPSSETRSDSSSRRSLSSSSGSKPQHSNKKLPTPTMISDFSAVSPKVYPHTCSLCHTQCDQEKDWVDHINTVNHTAACRDLRNKYPSWKPNLPSRSGRYGSKALWNPKHGSPSRFVSRSLSGSPTPSPPRSKHRGEPHFHERPHGRPYSPHRHPRHPHYPDHSHQFEQRHSGSHRISSSSREHHPDRRDGESTGGFYRSSGKFSADTGRRPPSSKTGQSVKHGPLQHSTKTVKAGIKPGTKTTKGIVKPPLVKKKKKVVAPVCDSSVADRLVYLTGIPKDASEQEVTDLVGSFGKINNVILMPCSDTESESGEVQEASVCMVTAEGAQALASSTNLSIRDQQITAALAKKPEALQSSDTNNSKPKPKLPGQDTSTAGKEQAAGDAEQKTSDEKVVVLITGFPPSGWSERDIIQLVQPFGTPSDIILATDIGKVLVSVPDMEIAQEMIKVHTFIPMKIADSELKMTLVKPSISLKTPVALYNLLMGSLDTLESPALVAWTSLLVISNVPHTPTGSSEVQKLVRRFGTVIKTLVLNSVVICEMATPAMAMSVFKRFRKFPCVIHNNPLFFSRKPDPKSAQTKVIAAYVESSEDKPANGKGNQATAGEAKEGAACKEESQSPLEGLEKDVVVGDENINGTKKTENEALGENGNEGEEIKKDDVTNVPDFVAAPDAKPGADPQADVKETPALETVKGMTEDKETDNAPKAGNEKTPAGEETKPASCDDKTVSHEVTMPEFPKVTQEMVNLLLVQCRTRTASSSNSTAPTDEPGGTQIETQPGKEAAETKDTAEIIKEKDEAELVKRREKEQRDREARKEREARERERKEKERRAWEKEERARKERERDERGRRDRERREDERRERERRERKRPYGDSFSGSRSSHRSEGYRQSSWRDERHNEWGDDTKDVEESNDFPFDMSDFVTVDEVGDVTELPSPAVPMETEEGEDGPESKEDTPAETKVSDEAATLSESEPVMESPADSCATMVSQNVKPDPVLTAAVSPPPALHSDSSPGQTVVATCEPEAPEKETILKDGQVEPSPTSTPPPAPADSSPNNTGITESQKGELEQTAISHIQEKEEQKVELVTDEGDKVQDEEDKKTVAPPVETGKHERSEDQTNPEEETVRKRLKTETPMSTDNALPPYNPNNPVGLDFLVPKTGFFCKVCNRFFSGAKEAEINHCKTLKHYENLQKHLETTKATNVTTKCNP